MNKDTFNFPQFLLPEFMTRLEKLNGKLSKMKDANQVEIVARRDYEDYVIILNKNVKVIFTEIKIKFPVQTKFTGFEYVGTINFQGGIRTVFSLITNLDLSNLTTNHCEHCSTNRNRKRVHVFQRTDGTLFTIGNTCALQYTGLNIDSILNIYFKFVDQESDSTYVKTHMEHLYHNHIDIVLEAIRKAYNVNNKYQKGNYDNGYYDDAAYTPTKNLVDIYLRDTTTEVPNNISSSTEIKQLLVNEFKSLDVTTNTFNLNLYNTLFTTIDDQLQLRDFYLNKCLNLLIWAVYKVLNNKENVAKLDANNQFIGTINQEEIINGIVTTIKSIDGLYGPSTLVIMNTPKGAAKFFSSAKFVRNLMVNDNITIKGVVSKHEIFKEFKSTLFKKPKLIKE